MAILVTGGAGFIGSNFVLDWRRLNDELVVNLDKLSYAANLQNLIELRDDPGHLFIKGDISDLLLVSQLLRQYRPRAVLHFAAESHVDRSIDTPQQFIQTNIVGTFQLLESVRAYRETLAAEDGACFRFLHVSTDEVYGSLAAHDPPFKESHRYAPNNPYSASKAASDHLVRAYGHTYALPTLTTHCSNNYGPYQFAEKLIPLSILNALSGKPLSLYGDGQHVRDWLYVSDHCSAIRRVLEAGQPGETYHIGGRNEKTNLEVAHQICDLLEVLRPRPDGNAYRAQIRYVSDRAGHDRRYAIDSSKIQRTLGWRPIQTFESGLRKTVQWYLDHPAWA